MHHHGKGSWRKSTNAGYKIPSQTRFPPALAPLSFFHPGKMCVPACKDFGSMALRPRTQIKACAPCMQPVDICSGPSSSSALPTRMQDSSRFRRSQLSTKFMLAKLPAVDFKRPAMCDRGPEVPLLSPSKNHKRLAVLVYTTRHHQLQWQVPSTQHAGRFKERKEFCTLLVPNCAWKKSI